jgi:Leucine-rich repeat (LRR) protein
MKNIHHILLFALLSATPALLRAQCNNYACKMELARKALKKGEYKSALDHVRGAESYDASKKNAVNLFIDEVFAAIEQKKKDAEDGEKKVKKALAEAKAAKALAEAEKQNALAAKATAEAAEKKATAVLDKIYFYKDRFGLAYDQNEGSYGFIDKNLTTKIEFKYEEALPFDESGFAKVKGFDGAYYFIDTFGNEYPLATDLNQLSPKITALNLRGKRLAEIPDTVLKSVQLKVLLLSSNQLSSLPAAIGGLKNLTALNLFSNKLSSLPAEIGGLKNLTELRLSENQLSSLPAEIGELKNLTDLNLGSNQLSSLPAEIGGLKNLTDLNLGSNQLSSLPAEIGGLKNLTRLDFGDNQFAKLPAEILELKNLTELYLRKIQLSILSAEIGELKNLTTLGLGGNELRRLPPEIGNLKNLTHLYLWGNQLNRWPGEIDELKNLTLLDLSGNQLSSWPAEIGELKNLQEVDLYGNNLTDLPILVLSKLTNLKTIVLANQYGTNPLPETTISALRVAMPWCEIRFDPEVLFEKNQQEREQYAQSASQGEAQLKSNPNDTAFQKELADTYNSLGWYQLLTGQFSEAEASIRRGLTLDATNAYLPTNLAPALLLQGKTTTAIQEYTKWKGMPYDKNGFPFYRDAFLSDLNALESAGVIPEARKADVEAVRALLRKE